MFFGLEITIAKEMKSTSTKKKFRRVIHVSALVIYQKLMPKRNESKVLT